MAFLETDLADFVVKGIVFVMVQALVYVILSSSSNLFSRNKMRSFSFKPARSSSINRILASVSDFQLSGDQPPVSSKRMQFSSTQDDDQMIFPASYNDQESDY